MLNVIKSEDISTCYYLFQQEADFVFPCLKFESSKEKRSFVDQCLNLIIKINAYIFIHKDALFLIDPNSLSHQCHLFSLKIAQLKNQNPKQEDLLKKTENNRFLHLSFLLSYFFSKDPNVFANLVKSMLREMDEPFLSPKNKFFAFLRDETKHRERLVRRNLNALMEKELKNDLTLNKHLNALYEELFTIAHQNLKLDVRLNEEKIYTYPKLAGIAYFIDLIAREKIAFVLKVKVLTKEGQLGNVVLANRLITKEEPVVIFEGLATDGSYSLLFCTEKAKSCPSYFYHNHQKNLLHDSDQNCFFCKKVAADLTPFRERLEGVMQSPEKLLYALGTDFILNIQTNFIALFEDRQSYPILSNLFTNSISYSQENGLTMHNPTTFSVCHVHTDTGEHALSEHLLLEQSPSQILNQRGLLCKK